ncbi:RHS repeat-associated protein [Luteibacter sp. Sphag1AF]|nr:RHS repeat-associated core domain-containing protein [Luteibacter sp. Sphag1AF]MBB3225411.1 RHS repeat-associated protein [Luteibacter sp. Sphag1AF]
MISETSSPGSRSYVYLDGLLVATSDVNGSSTKISFVYVDALGSPRVVADASGEIDWRWGDAGNAFGEVAPVSLNGFTLHSRFPGQYFDTESGLNYNVNRDYAAAAGRYIQSDPIGLQGGAGTYVYALGNPLVFLSTPR